MYRFEEGILGLIKPEDWLQVGFDATRPNDPVDELFGDIKTENIIAYWESMAAEYNLPVMAQFHAFDVEAQKTLRRPVDVHNIEKGLIKVKIDQSERLLALLGRGVNGDDELYKRVLNDGYNLSEEVFTRTKVAKNEVLATGKMTINENNLSLTVDYGVPADHLNKEIDFGPGASETVAEQLLELTDEAAANGFPLTGIYTSKAMVNKLRQDASIQKAINGSLMVGQLVRNADLRAYLNDEFGISRILVNDAHYSLPLTMGADGRPVVNSQRYFPANKLSFFHADGKIGDGLWGDPPAVRAKNATGIGNVSGSDVSPYVFVSQYKENDPEIVWTKAEGLFMPVLYNPNALYVATAKSTPGA